MGECGGSNIWRLRIHRSVEGLCDAVRYRSEANETILREAGVVLLQLEVRDDRRQVCVACALTQTIQGALHVARTSSNCRHRVCDRASGVVMAVDSDRCIATDVCIDLGHDVFNLMRQ